MVDPESASQKYIPETFYYLFFPPISTWLGKENKIAFFLTEHTKDPCLIIRERVKYTNAQWKKIFILFIHTIVSPLLFLTIPVSFTSMNNGLTLQITEQFLLPHGNPVTYFVEEDVCQLLTFRGRELVVVVSVGKKLK